jgi:hypothetical protein
MSCCVSKCGGGRRGTSAVAARSAESDEDLAGVGGAGGSDPDGVQDVFEV